MSVVSQPRPGPPVPPRKPRLVLDPEEPGAAAVYGTQGGAGDEGVPPAEGSVALGSTAAEAWEHYQQAPYADARLLTGNGNPFGRPAAQDHADQFGGHQWPTNEPAPPQRQASVAPYHHYLHPDLAALPSSDPYAPEAPQPPPRRSPSVTPTRPRPIVLDISQYSAGAPSACTFAALEAAYQALLLGRMDEASVRKGVEFGGLYSGAEHPFLDEILRDHPRFAKDLETLATEQVSAGQLGDTLRRAAAENGGARRAIVLVKAPETICVILDARAGEYAIFDSHPRPEIGIYGASYTPYPGLNALTEALLRLFPPDDMLDISEADRIALSGAELTHFRARPGTPASAALSLDVRDARADLLEMRMVATERRTAARDRAREEGERRRAEQLRALEARVDGLARTVREMSQGAQGGRATEAVVQAGQRNAAKLAELERVMLETAGAISERIMPLEEAAGRSAGQMTALQGQMTAVQGQLARLAAEVRAASEDVAQAIATAASAPPSRPPPQVPHHHAHPDAIRIPTSSFQERFGPDRPFTGDSAVDLSPPSRSPPAPPSRQPPPRPLQQPEADTARRIREQQEQQALLRLAEQQRLLDEQERRDRELAMQTQEQFDRDEELAIRLSQRIFECDICACEHPVDDVFLFSSGCAGNHMYCRRCISAHVRSEMQALHIPVICPGCKASPQGSGAAVGEMCQADVELVLGDGDMQRYLQLSLEMWKLASGRGVVVCPYPDCRGLVLLEEEDEEEVHMVCQVDNSHEWCRKCEGGKWHNDSTCEQYQQWLQENGNGDRLMDELFRGKAWKRCTSCREGVEKTEGCNHMTCRCGGHFCYLCNTNLPANAPYEHFREPSSPCYNKLFDAAELAESEEDEE